MRSPVRKKGTSKIGSFVRAMLGPTRPGIPSPQELIEIVYQRGTSGTEILCPSIPKTPKKVQNNKPKDLNKHKHSPETAEKHLKSWLNSKACKVAIHLVKEHMHKLLGFNNSSC